MKIKVNQISKTEKIKVHFDKSRELWEDERNAANNPHEMDGYREEDI